IPETDAVEYLKDSIKKAYGKKGEKIVNMNYKAVDAGMNALVKVTIPANWADAKDAVKEEVNEPDFVKNIVRPMNAQEGDNL
ncbi:hypothetical protein LJB68_15230, partial [bacterium 210820-DFI.6.52]|nr:hypothetical protein [bacterium 210820-DFI.6.52]